jgi:hypothetical protein
MLAFPGVRALFTVIADGPATVEGACWSEAACRLAADARRPVGWPTGATVVRTPPLLPFDSTGAGQ